MDTQQAQTPATPPAAAPETVLTSPPQPTDAGKTGAAPNGQTPTQGQQLTEVKEIELKFPPNFQADAELVGQFKATAKELNLPGEGAQKLADLYVKAQTQTYEKAKANWDSQQAAWKESLKSDKELGGSALEQNALLAKKAMQHFGATPELKQFLNESGAGNYPELVRFMVRVGKSLAEDTVSGANAGPGGHAVPSEDALLRQFFPTHFPKE